MTTVGTTQGTKERVLIYVSGAFLANVPFWLLQVAVSFVQPVEQSMFLTILGYQGAFFGAALGSFLVARKLHQSKVETGLAIGLIAYIVNAVFTTFLGTQLLLTGDLAELLMMMVFAVGGVLGNLIYKKRRELKAKMENQLTTS